MESKSSLCDSEVCSGTDYSAEVERITDMYHKGSCRLVPCSVVQKGHKRVARKDKTRVVDRASCVGDGDPPEAADI